MLFFAGTLFPALGFFNVYPFRYSFVADHFQYLASIGVLTLVAATSLACLQIFQHEGHEAHEGDEGHEGNISKTSECENLDQLLPKVFAKLSSCPSCLRVLRALRGEKILIGALIVTLAVLTWRQSHEYIDAKTLYRATIARNPASWMIRHNLGWVLLGEGRATGDRSKIDAAVTEFRAALALKPDFSQVHNNLGTAFLALDETIRRSRRSTRRCG